MTLETPLPTAPEALMAKLESMGIPYVLYHHKPVFTCEESEFLKAEIAGLHVKNLFLKDKKDRMVLITLPHEISLDLKAVAPAIGLDRISFGSPDRLWKYLGVRPGSVCPFAAMNDTAAAVQVILHKSVADATEVSAHPMLNTMSVSVSGADLVRFLINHGHPPKIMDLTPFHRASAA